MYVPGRFCKFSMSSGVEGAVTRRNESQLPKRGRLLGKLGPASVNTGEHAEISASPFRQGSFVRVRKDAGGRAVEGLRPSVRKGQRRRARWEGEDVSKKEAPLTSQQLYDTAQSVLQAILQIDAKPNDNAAVTTPASGIVIMTPDAPFVPKIKNESNGGIGRCRSLDTLTSGSLGGNIFNFPDPGALTAKSHYKMDDIEQEHSRRNFEKERVSEARRAPTVNALGRSDTFVREEEEKLLQGNDSSKTGEEHDAFIMDDIDVPSSVSNTVKTVLLPKLEALRKSLFDVASKIDDVKKEACLETSKPIRRLSSIGAFPGLTRSSIGQYGSAIPPQKMRRSVTAIPGTPTSSRLNVTITKDKPDATNRRKSVSTVSLNTTGSTNLTVSTNRLSPSLSTQSIKKSPNSGGRPAKNPKYAHVQSTIPKLSAIGKRKAQ